MAGALRVWAIIVCFGGLMRRLMQLEYESYPGGVAGRRGARPGSIVLALVGAWIGLVVTLWWLHQGIVQSWMELVAWAAAIAVVAYLVGLLGRAPVVGLAACAAGGAVGAAVSFLLLMVGDVSGPGYAWGAPRLCAMSSVCSSIAATEAARFGLRGGIVVLLTGAVAVMAGPMFLSCACLGAPRLAPIDQTWHSDGFAVGGLIGYGIWAGVRRRREASVHRVPR